MQRDIWLYNWKIRYQKMTLSVANAFLHFLQGILLNKLYASSTPASDVSTRYLSTKSHRYCSVCRKKRKTNASYYRQGPYISNVFKYNIILFKKARACPFHFVGKELKDSYLQKIFSQSNSGYKSNVIRRDDRTTYKASEAIAEI